MADPCSSESSATPNNLTLHIVTIWLQHHIVSTDYIWLLHIITNCRKQVTSVQIGSTISQRSGDHCSSYATILPSCRLCPPAPRTFCTRNHQSCKTAESLAGESIPSDCNPDNKPSQHMIQKASYQEQRIRSGLNVVRSPQAIHLHSLTLSPFCMAKSLRPRNTTLVT